MNIRFDGADGTVRNHTNVDRDTTTYRTAEDTGKVSARGFALDISGTVMDNSAYAGHGRTAEEVMQEAGQQDLTARRNYMAVMSNSMSDEDFAKLQKEGFHPGSEDIETVVTIVDHIKAALVKGGTNVAGYTDTLEDDKLIDITGSRVFANELKKQFAQYDIPLTEENITAVKEAWNTLEGVGDFTEGSQKYMIENELSPTVENFYTASFSATEDASRQGKGYYAAGSVAGYYAKKPESIDYEQLMPQIEKVIQESGYSVNEETVTNAKWLIEKGIPLNQETFFRKQQMEDVVFPKSPEAFAKAAAIAIADGKKPLAADITKDRSNLEIAISVKEQVEQVSDEAVDIIKANHLPFTLKNLFAAYEEWRSEESHPVRESDESGRNLLAQVRASMTISSNLRLIRSGFAIETMPVEMLAKQLDTANRTEGIILTGEADEALAGAKNSLFRQTLYALETIKWAPAAMEAEITQDATLPEIEDLANARSAAYQKAGEAYETLLTAPRRDMGDSIHKAFRNVDDILADMQKDIHDKNRKVIRILGYNSMEMTEENFEQIRQTDELLTDVVDKMKPATVLSMIREGVNPLTMSLAELQEYLTEQQPDVPKEIESYSKFLYQLEQKNGISEDERSAYIGIYRLLRQIEKGDNAAIGAVLKADGMLTLENLLTAVRTGKKRSVDYTVNNAFGGVNAKDSGIPTILEQIEKGYMNRSKQLEAELSDAQTKEAAEEFDKITYKEIRNAMGSEAAVLQHLTDYHQSISAEHLFFAKSMMTGNSEAFMKYRKFTADTQEDVSDESMGEEKLLDEFTGKEAVQENYREMIERMQQKLEGATFTGIHTSLDIKAMGMLYKQLGFMGSMAKEENYEMPVNIGGNLTTVNLKMIHTGQKVCKVAVSFETKELGKNEAEFSFMGEALSGYSISESRQTKELLEQQQERFAELLAKEDLQAGDIRFLTGEGLDIEEFASKTAKGREEGRTPDTLYKAAKAYIGYIQEISNRKEDSI